MNEHTYISDVPHPGEFIREEIEARDWSQRDLAYILGISEQSINTIIAGKRGISPDMAKALGDAFDVSPEYFSNLQAAHDMSRARAPDPGVAKRAKIQSAYPVREMIKRGWFEDTDTAMLEAQMMRFFKVNRMDDIPYFAHVAKKTDYEGIPATQLAWLFRVRQIAETIAVPKFSLAALKDAVVKLRNLLSEPEEIRHVPRILAECGVRYVIVECLPNSKIDGVCFWIDKSPVIGMSLRHDRIDNFWFVLRHEIEHVIQGHGKVREIIDAELEGERAGVINVSEEERVANQAAADFCVSQKEILLFIARKSPFFAERDVLGFAGRLNVHPGLVVGQIQNKTGRWDFLRKYLVKIRQFAVGGAITDGWGNVASVSL